MAKLPYMQFFPADWLGDTRPLSLAAKGAWIDILCILHASVTRGVRTMPVVAWARTIGATADQAVAVIDELANTQVADVIRESGEGCNAVVTLRNRRMSRDSLTAEQTRLRVEKHRVNKRGKRGNGGGNTDGNAGCNGPGNADVTPYNLETIIQKTPVVPLPGDEKKPGSDGSDKPPEPPQKPPKAKGPLQLRAEALMRRRPSTPLTDAEARAFRKNKAAIEATAEEDWQALEAFYAAPQRETFARKDLATLVNNWNGEIDRARAWVAEHGQGHGRPPAVPPPPAEPSGWREYVAEHFPNSDYAPGQPKAGAAWADVPPEHRQWIMASMREDDRNV
ncbi:hypothetical protein OpiT1DRAFT_05433 [Opitutaceae bacterium TAV1]|nr:hypothetical protein OpiT1DRAFT_05433 [Opitutaceae bacterium TAV1]